MAAGAGLAVTVKTASPPSVMPAPPVTLISGVCCCPWPRGCSRLVRYTDAAWKGLSGHWAALSWISEAGIADSPLS